MYIRFVQWSIVFLFGCCYGVLAYDQLQVNSGCSAVAKRVNTVLDYEIWYGSRLYSIRKITEKALCPSLLYSVQ